MNVHSKYVALCLVVACAINIPLTAISATIDYAETPAGELNAPSSLDFGQVGTGIHRVSGSLQIVELTHPPIDTNATDRFFFQVPVGLNIQTGSIRVTAYGPGGANWAYVGFTLKNLDVPSTADVTTGDLELLNPVTENSFHPLDLAGDSGAYAAWVYVSIQIAEEAPDQTYSYVAEFEVTSGAPVPLPSPIFVFMGLLGLLMSFRPKA